MWGCGLKSLAPLTPAGTDRVTPYVGVWIEIMCLMSIAAGYWVTPYVGVWIEIG